jgi:hypothetical protein
MKITHYEEWRFDSTLFFNEVSVHFYGHAPTRNKCVYALSIPLGCKVNRVTLSNQIL